MPNPVKGILFACITAFLWGTLAVVLKISLTDLTPAEITWFRFFLAFAALLTYYFYRKPSALRILRKPPLLLIVSSVCLAINYFGFIKGVQLTSPSVAQIFIQVGPVLLAVSGFLLFKEKISTRQMLGLVIALTGLVLFYREQMRELIAGQLTWRIGVIWVLAGGLAWTFYSVLLKILVLHYPPMQLNLVIFGLPMLLYLPFVHLGHFTHLSVTGWSLLLFLGLNTLFAYGLLSLAIRYTEANKVSIILILNPILTFAIMAVISHTQATFIPHEHFSLSTLSGAFIVLAGALLTIFNRLKDSR
jgi:drug/metabolite transporter (DMT)-like permease